MAYATKKTSDNDVSLFNFPDVIHEHVYDWSGGLCFRAHKAYDEKISDIHTAQRDTDDCNTQSLAFTGTSNGGHLISAKPHVIT